MGVIFAMEKFFQWASYIILVILIIDRTFFRFFSAEFVVAAVICSLILKIFSNKS